MQLCQNGDFTCVLVCQWSLLFSHGYLFRYKLTALACLFTPRRGYLFTIFDVSKPFLVV